MLCRPLSLSGYLGLSDRDRPSLKIARRGDLCAPWRGTCRLIIRRYRSILLLMGRSSRKGCRNRGCR